MLQTCGRHVSAAVTAVCLATAYIAAPVWAATGTNVKGHQDPNQIVLWARAPQSVIDIRRLIGEGKVEAALVKAQDFVDEHGTGEQAYWAYNALCVALTANRALEAALEACDESVSKRVKGWHALNNRGTVHFMAGRFVQAERDYRQALEIYPDSEVIRHNLALVEARRANS